MVRFRLDVVVKGRVYVTDRRFDLCEHLRESTSSGYVL